MFALFVSDYLSLNDKLPISFPALSIQNEQGFPTGEIRLHVPDISFNFLI